MLTRFALRYEPRQRGHKCAALIKRACDAACYVQITGHAHPYYGDGSISALVARVGLANLSANLDRNGIHAFETVLEQLDKSFCKLGLH